jgi:hypothetical protein
VRVQSTIQGIFHNLLNLGFLRTKEDDCLSLARENVTDPLGVKLAK